MMQKLIRPLFAFLFVLLGMLALSSLFKTDSSPLQETAKPLPTPGNIESTASLKSIRDRRDDARREELIYLQKSIDKMDEDAPIALTLKSKLIENIESEMVIETVALTRGYSDVCALVSENAVYVIVCASGISEESALFIRDSAARQCGINVNDVSIILQNP